MSAPRLIAVTLWVLTLAAGCAGGPGGGSARGPGESSTQPAAPKKITAAINGVPHTLYQQLNPASRVCGIETLEQLVGAGLALQDKQARLQPQIAEQVPSIENGMWRLLADGRMETTWRIRDGVQWHDGTPFSTDDLVFTAQVVQDPALPIFNNAAYDMIDAIDVPDSRTILVRWKQPFIEADTLFTTTRALPFPKHILETAYR